MFYGGVSNIGRKPTIQGENPIGVETYVMGLEEDLYGKDIQVQLLNFERPEQKFDSLDALKERIGKDQAICRGIHGSTSGAVRGKIKNRKSWEAFDFPAFLSVN